MKAVISMDCQVDLRRLHELSHVGRQTLQPRSVPASFNGRHSKQTQQMSEVGVLLCCVRSMCFLAQYLVDMLKFLNLPSLSSIATFQTLTKTWVEVQDLTIIS